MTSRALLEKDPDPVIAEIRRKEIINRLSDLEIDAELEPDEWKILQRPVGSLDRQADINAWWRLEGLAVLVWALQRYDLPPYDQLIDTDELHRSIGFWDMDHVTLTAPLTRCDQELEAMRTHLFALHWRLREFTLTKQPIDFVKFARECWFGPLNVSSFRFIDNDLSLGQYAISQAPEGILQSALSSAMERHQAINWLCGYSEVYSEIDTST